MPVNHWTLLSSYQVVRNGKLWLDRLRLVQTPWFGLYLHRIHSPDVDPDPHDHPWMFASLVLAGGYTESVWDSGNWSSWRVHERRRGSLHRMSTRQAHKITRVDGQLWTLVLVGPKVRTWGFWAEDGFVPWREYLAAVDEEAALWAS